MESRRDAIKLALAGTVFASGAGSARAAVSVPADKVCRAVAPQWQRGIEGQRKSDLGDC